MSFYYICCNNVQVNMVLERVFRTEEEAVRWDRAYSGAWNTPPSTNIAACTALYDDAQGLWIMQQTDSFSSYRMKTFTNEQLDAWTLEMEQLAG